MNPTQAAPVVTPAPVVVPVNPTQAAPVVTPAPVVPATTQQTGNGGANANGNNNNPTGGSTGNGVTNAYGMISGDPHIKIKGANQEPVCFDITPKGSSILNLLFDPVSRLEVNGEVVTEAHQKHRNILKIKKMIFQKKIKNFEE